MSTVTGTWNVVQKSILGETPATWTITDAGNGTYAIAIDDQASKAQAHIENIRVSGMHLSADLVVTKPVNARSTLELDFVGDAFTGTAKAKFLPGGTFRGSRLS